MFTGPTGCRVIITHAEYVLLESRHSSMFLSGECFIAREDLSTRKGACMTFRITPRFSGPITFSPTSSKYTNDHFGQCHSDQEAVATYIYPVIIYERTSLRRTCAAAERVGHAFSSRIGFLKPPAFPLRTTCDTPY